MKKFLKWGLIIFIGLIVIGVIAGSGSDNKKVGSNTSGSGSNSSETANNEGTSDDQQEIYAVGDSIQMGDVILTVNEVETSESGQFTSPSEGNHWVDLNITIENTGSSQEYITTLGQMFIIDGDNNQYQIATTGKRLENAGSLGLDGAIVAKAKKTDWVGFEVPKTATGLKFQYNASFWNNKNILIDLGL